MKVVCCGIRRKTQVRIPAQASKRNMKKNISSEISFQQISGKSCEKGERQHLAFNDGFLKIIT